MNNTSYLECQESRARLQVLYLKEKEGDRRVRMTLMNDFIQHVLYGKNVKMHMINMYSDVKDV